MFRYKLRAKHSYTVSEYEIAVLADTYEEATQKADKALPSANRTGYKEDHWYYSLINCTEELTSQPKG